jgi:hypothetical protein
VIVRWQDTADGVLRGRARTWQHRGMGLPVAVKGVASMRLGVGAVAVLAPRLGAKLFKFPAADTNASSMALSGMFGVREAVLGTIMLTAAEAPRARLKQLYQLNAMVDGVDALVMLLLAARHKSLRVAALMILPLAASSVAGHLKAAQEIGVTA